MTTRERSMLPDQTVNTSPLPPGRISGLIEALKVVADVEGIGIVHFDDRDVVRHALVQRIVKAYETYTTAKPGA